MSIRGPVICLILASASLPIAASPAAVARESDRPSAEAINDPTALIKTAIDLLNSSKSFDEEAVVAAFHLNDYQKSQWGILHGYRGPPDAFIRGLRYYAHSDGHEMAELDIPLERCLQPGFVASITGVAVEDNYDHVWALHGTLNSYERVKQGVRFEWKIPTGLAIIALVGQAPPDGSCYHTLRIARRRRGSPGW